MDDLAGIILGSIALFAVLLVVWAVLNIVARWMIFKKAGETPWHSIIPFYARYCECKFTWNVNYFWAYVAVAVLGSIITGMGIPLLPAVCSLLSLVFLVISAYLLARSFGHGVPFAIGLVVFGPVFRMILGFGPSRYEGNKWPELASLLKKKTGVEAPFADIPSAETQEVDGESPYAEEKS